MNYSILVVLMSLIFVLGCDKGGAGGLSVDIRRGQIASIHFDGVDVVGQNGGLYLIGSCGHPDGPDNLISYPHNDGYLRSSTGRCKPVPYSMQIKQDGSTLTVELAVGPLPEDLTTLSVPLDPDKSILDSYEFGGVSAHEVGCADAWRKVLASGGRYSDIPALCRILTGYVGAAKAGWAEYLRATGRITIERRIVQGMASEFLAYNHPGTNNLEIALCAPCKAGQIYGYRETISFW